MIVEMDYYWRIHDWDYWLHDMTVLTVIFNALYYCRQATTHILRLQWSFQKSQVCITSAARIIVEGNHRLFVLYIYIYGCVFAYLKLLWTMLISSLFPWPSTFIVLFYILLFLRCLLLFLVMSFINIDDICFDLWGKIEI